jgi:hypothetical protein
MSKKSNKYEDFTLGSRVKLVNRYKSEYSYLSNLTGIVVENLKRTFGIIVQFNRKSMVDGFIDKDTYVFNPSDLEIINKGDPVIAEVVEYVIQRRTPYKWS